MTVWIITAVTVAAIIIGRFIASLHNYTTDKHHSFIEMGSEQEEFWIPGDPKVNTNDYDFDFEDFEDL